MIIAMIYDRLPSSSKMGKGRIKTVLTTVLQLENEINTNLKRRNKIE